MAKLSPAQRTLIDAMNGGAIVSFMTGLNAFAHADRPCPGVNNITVTVLALERAGIVERWDHRANGNFRFRLTEKGKAL